MSTTTTAPRATAARGEERVREARKLRAKKPELSMTDALREVAMREKQGASAPEPSPREVRRHALWEARLARAKRMAAAHPDLSVDESLKEMAREESAARLRKAEALRKGRPDLSLRAALRLVARREEGIAPEPTPADDLRAAAVRAPVSRHALHLRRAAEHLKAHPAATARESLKVTAAERPGDAGRVRPCTNETVIAEARQNIARRLREKYPGLTVLESLRKVARGEYA